MSSFKEAFKSAVLNPFCIGSGIIGLAGGGVASLAFGHVAAAPVVALAAAVGAGGTSALTMGVTGALFDGKGPEAGFMGMICCTLAHLTLVPAGAVLAARYALTL